MIRISRLPIQTDRNAHFFLIPFKTYLSLPTRSVVRFTSNSARPIYPLRALPARSQAATLVVGALDRLASASSGRLRALETLALVDTEIGPNDCRRLAGALARMLHLIGCCTGIPLFLFFY
jgi:hypothetical protein